MGKKGISRRDFMKKTIQYASAGAVLGGMAGLEGVNPPKAEAQETQSFLDFVREAQTRDVKWLVEFLNNHKKFTDPNDSQVIDQLSTLFKDKGFVPLSKGDAARLLEVNIKYNTMHKQRIMEVNAYEEMHAVPLSY